MLHGRWTYFEANSRYGGEESFQDEACEAVTNNDDDDDDDDNDDDDDVDDDDDGGVAGAENK